MANQRTPPEVGISAREPEVLVALGERLTNVEIGARLFISLRTVESHVSSLLRKFQVADHRALAVVAATTQSVSATADLVERALVLARRIDEPLIESAALDSSPRYSWLGARCTPRRPARCGVPSC